VEETAALDIGARLFAWDAAGTITTATHAGARVAGEAGVRIGAGDRRDDRALEAVAERIADLALRVAAGRPFDGTGVWLTEPLARKGPFPVLMFSGGVGEYINGWEDREYGDLGRLLGQAILRRATDFKVLRPAESIRATCIGASQYTVQVSGDTLFLTDPGILPLRNLAAVAVHPEAADAEAIAAEIRRGITRLDREDGTFALAIRWRHGPAYAALRALCTGIAEGTRGRLAAGGPLVIVLDADVAGIVGQILESELHIEAPLVCVDQIALSDLDFIDIGAVVPEHAVVPVVVKSLVFSER